jgi:hypothetical protein
LKPGGLTIHTIDHAPRNITWDDNFRRASFVPIDASNARPALRELLHATGAVRQQVSWTKGSEDLCDKELHSVLYVGYVKLAGRSAEAGPPIRRSWWELLQRRRH